MNEIIDWFNLKFNIGALRTKLLLPDSFDAWNGYVREKTAEIEMEFYRRFQPRREKCDCRHCEHCAKAGYKCPCGVRPSPTSEVEAQSKALCDEIARCWINREFVSAAHLLNDLIDLVRKEKYL